MNAALAQNASPVPTPGPRPRGRLELVPGLVDPRVAKHGGTRHDAKSHYDFPGMMDAASWRRTEVHKHTRSYGCALCGQKFAGPHAVYTHLAKIHDR